MLSPSRKDNELLKAKRLSKAALVAFACAFAWAGCTIKTDAPLPAQQPRTIELSFAQIQEIQPEETPEVFPEPLPQQVIEEPKKPLTDESELKVEPEKVVEEKLPESEAEPVPPPLVPVEQPKPKKVEPVKPKPVKKPKEPKVEQKTPAPQKASESTEGKAASVGHAAAEQAAKKKSITAMLVSLVEKHKRYPKAARRAGMEGVVLVEFSVDPGGKVTGASVIKKSGKGPLDSASQDLSKRIIGTAFNVPNSGMKIQVPIRYSLD
ncbi:energy transducer TonB [Parasutterella excrementihominis]|jgi:periplasmic protein TonB|uniref:energy transducer TonB n=1 Tax=Parasutterella excrementihominis TaxID=487175 RepID=UPI000E47AAC7|nr:energy transducer TonB [Parasutterella excrementihominis]RHU69373.1 energy transducer TonB [Burkholderiales bacterium]